MERGIRGPRHFVARHQVSQQRRIQDVANLDPGAEENVLRERQARPPVDLDREPTSLAPPRGNPGNDSRFDLAFGVRRVFAWLRER